MRKFFKRNISLILTAVLLLSIFSISPLVSAEKNVNSPTIYLKGMENNTKAKPNVSSTLTNKIYDNGEKGPYIVSFDGPVYDYMKIGIENSGAIIEEYIPDFSFLVMMTPEVAESVSKISYVKNIIVYEPLFKIDPDFMDSFGNIKDMGEIKVRILTFADTNAENQIQSFNIKEMESDMDSIIAVINSKEIAKLANLNSVKFIEPVPEFQLFNDVAKGYMGTEDIWNLGYTGEGQVVGVADTGLDTGKNDSSMHRDFQGRIDKIIPLGRNTADDPNGHGTHVAGSVLGNGASSNGQIKGMAPKAHLVFQSVLDSRGGLGGLPNNLNDLFGQSWNEGARIHTNSWGAAGSGVYNTTSRQVDEYLWNNNNMIILFAAGNEGQSRITGSTVYNSIGSPGTAKNCITVGASENYRPEKGNLGDNPNEIASFSSRGTCKDGRVKPDIIAPGTWILSTKSSKAPASNFWGEYNNYYAYMGGTSMATPLTAGSVAIAKEYMMKEWKHTPSPAMMKASVVNGATDMGYGYPSRDQGWGRINLEDSLKSKQYKYEDEVKSLSTGQVANYTYSIKSNKTPLKASLVWTDYPGSTSASKALVNDLDLKITSPSGVVYYGNDFTKPFNSELDRLNNVENIFINTPEVGNYKIEVAAYNVPQGPQPFVLFASGDFGEAGGDVEAPVCSITSPANGATVKDNISITADARDNVGVTKVEFYVDGKNIGISTKTPYIMNWDTTTVSNDTHELQVKAYDAAGNVGISKEISVVVDNKAEEPEDEYATETYSGSASFWRPYERTIDITAPGKITAELKGTSRASLKLYDKSGNVVSRGINSLSYDAKSIGKYNIAVSSTSFFGESFTLKVKYPVAKGNGGDEEQDMEAPICSITSPANGATVKDNISITADARDNVGVTKVEFYVDGENIGTSTKAPYTISWDTTEVSNDTHELQVKAYDAEGNVGISQEISVVVDNKVEEPEVEYVTETYFGSTSFWEDYEKAIDVTGVGNITVELSNAFFESDLSIELYDSSGNVVSRGTNSISYDVSETGKYNIVVSSDWPEYFTIKVTYPITK